VSVAVVPDLFSFRSASILSTSFDHVIPFKTHYLIDLEIGFDRYLRRNHRRYSSKGLSNFNMEFSSNPAVHGSEWAELYQMLIVRRRISGLQAFSPNSLHRQLEVPGCLYFRALRDGVLHGAMVCYVDRGRAYAHLISSTNVGLKLHAQYALYWTAIEHCRHLARWFLLGSVPGLLDHQGNSGLAYFKAGWATSMCQGYFCGQVVNRECYETLCAAQGAARANFPAYRDNPLA
jgi:hypothetical protein